VEHKTKKMNLITISFVLAVTAFIVSLIYVVLKEQIKTFFKKIKVKKKFKKSQCYDCVFRKDLNDNMYLCRRKNFRFDKLHSSMYDGKLKCKLKSV